MEYLTTAACLITGLGLGLGIWGKTRRFKAMGCLAAIIGLIVLGKLGFNF
ncbi:MAG: hypothetical protein HY764_00130 [Candidatus Portnoybacteria bacterium]|nr:hypothetical protein [Candidatus Portnoybacteria bacterium]